MRAMSAGKSLISLGRIAAALAALLIAGWVSAAAPAVPAGDSLKDRILAVVDEDPILASDLDRAIGLGLAAKGPTETDPDRYDKLYHTCDVLVIGAGPAGLAAALAAGRSGARVVLADEQSELGGSLLSDVTATVNGQPASSWVGDALRELGTLHEVKLLPRTTAFAYYDHNSMSLVERLTDHLGPTSDKPRQRLWRIRAKKIVLATGAACAIFNIDRHFEGDRWITEIVQGRGSMLSLTSIGLTLPMAELYEGIDLPEAPRRRPASGR